MTRLSLLASVAASALLAASAMAAPEKPVTGSNPANSAAANSSKDSIKDPVIGTKPGAPQEAPGNDGDEEDDED